MRIAVLAPYLPHDQIRHAGGRHLLNWLRALVSAGAEVTMVAPVREGDDPHLAAGEPFAVLPVTVPPAPRSRLRTASRLHLLGPEPGVAAAHAADARVGALLRASDIVEVHWTEWMTVEKAVRRRQGEHGRPTVLGVQDVFSDLKARQAASAPARRSRWIARLQRPLFTRAERVRCNRSAGVLVFSPRDEGLLRASGVTSPIRRIAIGVDGVEAPAGPASTPTVLFVAKLDRKENEEAAAWLLEDIWPLVREAVPDATLLVAGADPPPWLRSDRSAGVEVTGELEDLDLAYRRAAVVIAPLRRGAGLKVKVVEAMRHALPVVATEVAADGFDALGGRDRLAIVSDDALDLATATVDLLRDPERGRRVGISGHEWAARAFDTRASAAETLAWYRELVQRAPRLEAPSDRRGAGSAGKVDRP